MEAFPEAGFGLSAVPDPAGPCPRFLSPAEAYRENFFQRDLLGRAPGSAIIKRTAFDAVGGFSGKRQVGDHELWLKMARRFGVVKMPTDLVWDRQHPHQEKHFDSAVEKAVMHEQVQVEALHAEDCPLSPEERRAALARLEQTRGRRYWHFVRSEGGFAVAEAYRRKTAVPIPALYGAVWRFSAGG